MFFHALETFFPVPLTNERQEFPYSLCRMLEPRSGPPRLSIVFGQYSGYIFSYLIAGIGQRVPSFPSLEQ
jgi:hypothetical protein